LNNLNYNEKGLIPAIVQDEDTGDVLMLGYMNEESLRRTLASGEVWFFSRSRQELWHKGATSGNKLKLVSISKDCEDNSLLVKAHPVGPTCHTGRKSCFYRDLDGFEKKKS
jgi:phosphoribosyl-ATP pyrophosphohydrolase/phosphoribosyl-AMP cyclohydrolase